VLPTFVIGLREGLEAALIVGIIAAFLGQQGRKDALRQVWFGTAAAVAICVGVAIVLQVISSDLPQRQQEGLETVVGALAVGMVTYMIIFMRRHARGLKKDLEGAAASALASGSSRALVAMAFLAVLREGFETAVFLLATFQASGNASTSWLGAVLGIGLAAAVGYAIYKGGVRLNLARFFRVTGLVLVVVAAGLVMTAFHTASEAGWLTAGQAQAFEPMIGLIERARPPKTVEGEAERDVVACRLPRQQCVVLEQHADFGRRAPRFHDAGERPLQADDGAQQARLARARRPDQADELSLVDRKARAFQHGLAAIGDGQVTNAQRISSRRSTCRAARRCCRRA